jgi:diguanylate cyclase (GGDEF)-like protein/PAS domain S-box-containing protein/hemerythrin-like metal-binding protein
MSNIDTGNDAMKSNEQLVLELQQTREELLKIKEDCGGEEIFLSAFNFAAIGMALVAPDGGWLKVNAALCNLVGYTKDELKELTFLDITHPEDLDEDLNYVNQMITGGISTYQMEKRYLHKDGQIIFILLSVSLVRTKDGTPKFFISQIQDITQRKQLENELIHLATEDALTKVNNRRHFFEHAAREIARGERFREPQALLMIDIDNFKAVNDLYGHDVGDEVLIAMAMSCKKTLRTVDIFSRLGGEEFGALLLNTDPEIAHMIAERIRENIACLVVQTTKGPISFTVSIGLVAFLGGKKSLEKRLKLADVALYKAKRSGKNNVEVSVDYNGITETLRTMQTSFVSLVWKKEFECGHNTIDTQHQGLFKISNELLSSVITHSPSREIEQIIKVLVHHTTNHFHEEEAILRSAGYPLVDMHSNTHRNIEKEMENILEKFKEGTLVVGEVFTFLAVDVVANHMLDEDRKFFSYLNT